jgi:hypothetical protein
MNSEEVIESSNDRALQDIRAHERECSIRYQNIEKRLDEGTDKFTQIQNSINGLYAVIITGGIAIFGVLATLTFNLI